MPESFFDRLLHEKDDLDQKRNKLNDFIISAKFSDIDPIQQALLNVQLAAMETYTMCLQQRISHLEKKEGMADL